MDPTMGQAPVFATEQPTPALPAPTETAAIISMSGYLTQADMQADEAGGTEASGLAAAETDTVIGAEVSTEPAIAAALEEPTLAPETPPSLPKYPVGNVDFNKPFEVYKDGDYSDQLSNLSILTVLENNSYPVLVVGHYGGEQIVIQFDTDGDDVNGEYRAENIETGPRTKFVKLFIDGDREITADEQVYDSELQAKRGYSHQDVLGIFPVVIPPRDGVAASDETGVEDEEEGDDLEGTDEVAAVETAPAMPPHPDARWVNGRLIAPGQIISAYRKHFGVRQVEVIKTREHSYQTLFVKPEDGSNPYWALNKNIR
jgi:hypothetical protein